MHNKHQGGMQQEIITYKHLSENSSKNQPKKKYTAFLWLITDYWFFISLIKQHPRPTKLYIITKLLKCCKTHSNFDLDNQLVEVCTLWCNAETLKSEYLHEEIRAAFRFQTSIGVA